ncbi:uncharacterized protein LOC105084198 isoform X1 [Camelus bactrianus]|uniref:Uncharacterized protein LOC105084198 isoform X1 n=10 Tax=Camelus bactrianus TaxID=9837 RepID=A0AC58P2L0_CAMBA|nr:uncharacterized protein LOC105084198 [Camelus bactrianus]
MSDLPTATHRPRGPERGSVGRREPTRRRAALFCVSFLFFFFFSFFSHSEARPDHLSSQLQGCIAVGTPSFPWLPALRLLSPGLHFAMVHPNLESLVYAVREEDLPVELWPGSPRSRTRGLEDRVTQQKTRGGVDRQRQGPGKGKLGGALPIRCPPVLCQASAASAPTTHTQLGLLPGMSLGGQPVPRCGGILPESGAEDG